MFWLPTIINIVFFTETALWKSGISFLIQYGVFALPQKLYPIDHFHNDVKQSLKARRNIVYEKGDVPNSVWIGNYFEAEIRIQI